MTMHEFTIERTFDAPPELVWTAFTDPEIATSWFHPHELTSPRDRMRFDVREGGTYSYVMVAADGSEYPTGGTYLTVRDPEQLRFTWGDLDAGEAEAPVIDVRLSPTDSGGTRMIFHLSRLDDRQVAFEDVRTGWDEALDELAGTLAGVSR